MQSPILWTARFTLATALAAVVLTGCTAKTPPAPPATKPTSSAKAAASTGDATAAPADPVVEQLAFDTPEDAAAALRIAATNLDRDALIALFGPELEELSSGDIEVDKFDLQTFAIAMDRRSDIQKKADGTASILIGRMGVAFPVPLMQVNGKWMFDTLAGVEAMKDLRVGLNELLTIQFLRAIPDAQQAYKETDWDGDKVNSYATRLASTEGNHDGLYWPPAPDEPASPLGPYAAAGGARSPVSAALGYNGYFFRVLTAQGPGAPGGAEDWMKDGKLTGGFAVIAWPAIYDETAVMSFLVGADGVVYEQDLGPESKEKAAAIEAYDPSQEWKPVNDA